MLSNFHVYFLSKHRFFGVFFGLILVFTLIFYCIRTWMYIQWVDMLYCLGPNSELLLRNADDYGKDLEGELSIIWLSAELLHKGAANCWMYIHIWVCVRFLFSAWNAKQIFISALSLCYCVRLLFSAWNVEQIFTSALSLCYCVRLLFLAWNAEQIFTSALSLCYCYCVRLLFSAWNVEHIIIHVCFVLTLCYVSVLSTESKTYIHICFVFSLC